MSVLILVRVPTDDPYTYFEDKGGDRVIIDGSVEVVARFDAHEPLSRKARPADKGMGTLAARLFGPEGRAADAREVQWVGSAGVASTDLGPGGSWHGRRPGRCADAGTRTG